MALKKTGEWQKAFLPDEVDEEFNQAQRRALVLLVRVRDTEVRRLAQDLKSLCADVVQSQGLDASRRAALQMLTAYEELNQRIGVALRDLEDAEMLALG